MSGLFSKTIAGIASVEFYSSYCKDQTKKSNDEGCYVIRFFEGLTLFTQMIAENTSVEFLLLLLQESSSL